MTRKFSLLLLLTLLVTTRPFSANADSVVIEPVFLSIGDMTASEWYSTEDTRALFATVAMFDVILSDAESFQSIMADAVLNDQVYVGKQGLGLALFFCAEDQWLLVVYTPKDNDCQAGIIDASSRLLPNTYIFDSMVEEKELSSYFHVDGEMILETYSELLDALKE